MVSLTSLCFFAPVFLFHSPYAAVAGMTIAHGLQYLVLVGMMSVGDGGGRGASGGAGGRGGDRVVGVAAFVAIALLGGIALSGRHTSTAARRPNASVFGLYLGLVMTHFVVDAGLWRLRQPFPRALLASRLPYLVARSDPDPQALRPWRSEGDRSVADIG